MTYDELTRSYQSWSDDTSTVMPEPILLTNQDIFEDDSQVVNRLFFIIPDISSGELRCFIFFEENTFYKDASGDLSLLNSEFHICQN